MRSGRWRTIQPYQRSVNQDLFPKILPLKEKLNLVEPDLVFQETNFRWWLELVFEEMIQLFRQVAPCFCHSLSLVFDDVFFIFDEQLLASVIERNRQNEFWLCVTCSSFRGFGISCPDAHEKLLGANSLSLSWKTGNWRTAVLSWMLGRIMDT